MQAIHEDLQVKSVWINSGALSGRTRRAGAPARRELRAALSAADRLALARGSAWRNRTAPPSAAQDVHDG